MNTNILFLAIFLSLSGTPAQSMEQFQKTDLITAFKNSLAVQWIDKYKMPLMIGASGLIIARLAYSYLNHTREQVKQQIRTKLADKIKIEAYHVRDMQNKGIIMERGALLENTHPYYGYRIEIMTISNPGSGPQFFAEYKFNCDQTSETLEILFPDQA